MFLVSSWVTSSIDLFYFFFFLERSSRLSITAVAVFSPFVIRRAISFFFFLFLSFCVWCNLILSFGFVGSSSEIRNMNGDCTSARSIRKMCQTDDITYEPNLSLKTEGKFYFETLEDFTRVTIEIFSSPKVRKRRRTEELPTLSPKNVN